MKCEITIIILNFIFPNLRNHFVSERLIQMFHVTTTRSVKFSRYLSCLSIIFCILMNIHGLALNDNVLWLTFVKGACLLTQDDSSS